MIDHFKNYRPSLSDLTYDEQRAIHINIRASRLIRKQISKRASTLTPEQKRNKKLNDLIGSMSESDLELATAELERKKKQLGG